MFHSLDAEVSRLLSRLTQDIQHQLGDSLVGLYLHGSLVTGDFDPERSDLDLLAVLTTDPDKQDARRLREMHARLVKDFPAWQDRVEVEYVSLAALGTFRTQSHLMVRISPGEPLHLVEATRHYLLNWYMARQGVTLLGPPAGEVIPDIPLAEFVQGVREHAGAWKMWVTEMRHPGGQAYAVLTLCRALHTSLHGEQVSKKRAAREVQPLLPGWTPLIEWAVRWRDGGGTQTNAGDHHGEVVRFVGEVSDRISGGPPQTEYT